MKVLFAILLCSFSLVTVGQAANVVLPTGYHAVTYKCAHKQVQPLNSVAMVKVERDQEKLEGPAEVVDPVQKGAEQLITVVGADATSVPLHAQCVPLYLRTCAIRI